MNARNWLPNRAWRAVVLTLLLAALAGVAAVWLRTVHWPVEVVRIDGEMRHTDGGELEQLVTAHVQAGFFATELRTLRRELIELPWVRDATLRRVWPNRIEVEIREHAAAAVWNEDALVSQRGQVFRPDEITAEGLPRLVGPSGQAGKMLAYLATLDLRLQSVGLAVAAVKQDERRSWTVELDDGIEFRLGRSSIDARLDRLLRVWYQAVAGQREQVRAVDLRYPNGFAIAWRDEANPSTEGGA